MVLGLAGLLLAPIIPLLLLLGVAMLLIGAAAGLFGLGLLAAATGLVAIGASAAVIAGGIGIVGAAIIEILPKLGQALAEALVNFLQTIAENTPLIVKAMNAIILGMIEGVAGLIPDIVIVMMDMVTELLGAIVERLPEMIQQGYDILLAFLRGIADNVADIIATGLMIITETINGIAEGLPDLVDASFNLILTYLTAIEDAITEYMPQIIAAGFRIGAAIVTGMTDGLWDGLEIIKKTIEKLIQKAIDKIKEKWNIASPSKVTYEIAKFVVLGFVNGIKDNAGLLRDGFVEFGRKAQNGIKSSLDVIGQDINSALEFNPVVRPVLNLDEITTGVGRINRAFSGSAVLASLSYDSRPSASMVSTPDEQSTNDGVTFNQYNYSPKALDRTEIYRQTKTQVARLALREL